MLMLAGFLVVAGLCFFFAALGAYYPDSPSGYLNDFFPHGYLAAFCWIAAFIAFALHFV